MSTVKRGVGGEGRVVWKDDEGGDGDREIQTDG